MRAIRSSFLLLVSVLVLACPRPTGGQANSTLPERQSASEAFGVPQGSADAETLFSRGKAAYERGAWVEARENLRALLLGNPTFPRGEEAKLLLGLSHLKLGEARDAVQTLAPLHDQLPADRKAEVLPALVQASLEAHAWPEAVRFLSTARADATDPAQKAKLDAQLFELVDGSLPALEVVRLSEELPKSSPAWPLVQFKVARIAFHLRNWQQLEQALTTLEKEAPHHAFAAEAKQLRERSQKRSQVRADTVGVLLPLSGKYQRFGENVLAGIKLATANVPGLRLVVKDTAGEAEKAKAVVQELVLDEQAIALIGPVLTTEAQAAATTADELGCPIVTLSRDEEITRRGPFVFRNMLTNGAQARALVAYATKTRGMKSFGVLWPNIPYGSELMNSFWDAVEASDARVTAVERYEHDQTTFAPVIKKMVGRYYLEDRSDFLEQRREINTGEKDAYKQKKAMEKLRSNLKPVIDFEALFIPDQQRNVGLIAPALAVEDVVTNGCDARDMDRIAKTMGLDRPKDVKSVLLLGANGWNSSELVERGGKFVQCSIFVDGFHPGSDRPGVQAFVKAFAAANPGKSPDLLAAYGFDAGKLVRAIVESQKATSRDAFRSALSATANFPGATGPITVNAQNEAERPLFFLTIDRNGIKEIDPSTPPKELR